MDVKLLFLVFWLVEMMSGSYPSLCSFLIRSEYYRHIQNLNVYRFFFSEFQIICHAFVIKLWHAADAAIGFFFFISDVETG